MTAITHPSTEPAPRLWLLFGDRRGDNAQVQALAEMLGWPYEIKQLRWQSDYTVDPAEAGISLAGLDVGASDPLTAPWPDMVIGIGFRSAPISRWIAQQGGRIINIRLGRPRTELKPYDLVITTPQYGLPPAPNVRELPLPLVKANEAEVDKAVARWQPAFEQLPKPWIAVMLGGPTQHMAFDEVVARSLARDLQVLAQRTGGSLLITTSPRSPAGLKAIFGTLAVPHLFSEFHAGGENPYLALLALGDAAIVTSDSASMVADAAAFERPILIYELPWLGRSKKPGLIAAIKRHVRERRERRGMGGRPADPLDRFYDMLTRMGRARPRRNVLGLNQKLYQSGIARPFDPQTADISWRPAAVARQIQDQLVAEIKTLWRERQSSR
ncbi:ELM1/GtrOC1 family putative glycosyltransferase [Dongia deserti]|uniref:ELM1/GtrOC1 family putative glycosyltransferase n=1 Tax=Dongia deserti TaxID=2268030 RepID=UPI000E659B05|nr:ELM1/GtrOC1 family putative glycosyltransferase [Dongia deserti]